MNSDANNNRRRGEQHLLVSFCNTENYAPSVAAIDLHAEVPRVRFLNIKRRFLRLPGARGLCFWNGLVCVGHEGRQLAGPGFVLLDPERNFKKVGGGKLPTLPHSVCSKGEDLFFTLSREDSVYRVTRDEDSGRWEATRFWTFPGSSGARDEIHVNAIELLDGRLCISAGGKKEPGSRLRASAKRGFVWDIEREQQLMNDLNHPHSLLEVGHEPWTCETRAGRIVSARGDEHCFSGGPEMLARGLAVDDRYFYVGVSKLRVGSKSLGTFERYRGSCLIYRVDHETREHEVLIDLSEHRDEIYELLLV